MVKGWSETILGEIIIGKAMYGIGAPACTYKPGLPRYIRITDIDDNGKYLQQNIAFVDHGQSSNYFLSANDIVFARTGASVGKSYLYNINDGKLVYAGFLIKISINPIKADSRYIYAVVNTNQYWDWVKTTSVRSGQPGINGKQYESFPLLLPPLPEQRAIAQALSDVDGYISALERLIEKKQNVKKSAMQELLTGKRRLPGFDGEWVKTTLGDLCEIKDGTHQTPKYVECGIPFYSVENVTNNNFFNTKYISYSEHSLLTANYRIERGDILMTRIGSIGVCKYIDWDVDASFYVSLALLRCKEVVDAKWLTQYSQSEQFQKEIDLHSLQHAIPKKINLGNIGLLSLLLPSIQEQSAIAIILSDMDTEIDVLTAKLDKIRSIKQGMMQELLTGRIRLMTDEIELASASTKKHNPHFDDAVMIAGIVDALYSDKYPLGRKKVQKCLYLLRRHQDESTAAFKKKAAGPYADKVRYEGGEPIARTAKYIVTNNSSKGTTFARGANIRQALDYIQKWGYEADIRWLVDKLKYKKVDELELLATVDMAICDLKEEGTAVSLATIKNLIASNKEWKGKLDKEIFNDLNIARAIKELQMLF